MRETTASHRQRCDAVCGVEVKKEVWFQIWYDPTKQAEELCDDVSGYGDY